MGKRSKHIGDFLSVEELEKLTTPRLLAYRNSLYKVNEGPSWDEIFYGEKSRAAHKLSTAWREAMANVKSVLSKREHLDRSQKEDNGC